MELNNLYKTIENYLIQKKDKIKINSNEIINGDVFVALQGSKTHGNDYFVQALERGAKYIITDKKSDLFVNKKNILLVKNSLIFLLSIANIKRNIFKGKVIGITGSAGKTTVKENLKFFLLSDTKVSASVKSYNNYLGVLISLINMNLYCDFAIFEIGTSNFNEIRKLTSIVMPQQIIITNIFPTHIANFKNTRNVAKEKSDIFNPKYNPEVELLILPNSNSDESFLYDQAKKMNISKVITLGKNINSNYHIKKIDKKLNGISNVKIKTNKKLFEIDVNTILSHQIYNIIICLIIFNYNDLSLKNFCKKSIKVPKISGRGLEKIISINNRKIRFIDESYNASPITMHICINYFHKLELQKNQKKFLILGDMNELGEVSKKYHQNIIEQIINCNFDNVILSGGLFKSAIKDIKIKKNQIKYMSNEIEIIEFLRKNIHNNDTLLIKGSNSTIVNKLAKKLISNKE